MESTRFDYIKYDELATARQAEAKELCKALEIFINQNCPGRDAALALTNLEVVYMWIGKGIRDDQIFRNKQSEELLSRSDS